MLSGSSTSGGGRAFSILYQFVPGCPGEINVGIELEDLLHDAMTDRADTEIFVLRWRLVRARICVRFPAGVACI